MIEITANITIYELIAILLVIISLLWHLITLIESRKRLFVKLNLGLTMISGVVQEVFHITVKNDTEYTRIIDRVGFKGKRKNVVALTPANIAEWERSIELPKSIPPKQSHTFNIPAKEILNFPAVKYPLKAWATDSFGKKYFSNRLRYT